MSTGDCSLRLEQRDGDWVLAGSGADRFGLVNEYLGYLADRNYSLRTVRSYGFDLLAFCRCLAAERIEMAEVSTGVMLRFLAACRQARVPGRPGPNVITLGGGRVGQDAATTGNHRLAGGRRGAGQLRYLARPGHRRADAVLRAAQRRGARSGRYRR